MKLCHRNYAAFATMFLAAGLVPARPEEPARQRSAPIIFSEPKSDTVSSNLNQLDLKTSPFKRLESDLKKPFEIFDAAPLVGSFRPPSGLAAPPAATANNRRIKELVDKRAEMMFPGPDGGDTDLAGDDPFKTAEGILDDIGKKRKNPLDRYYDRLDRERAALTNQVRNPNRYGNNKSPEGKEPAGRFSTENSFDGDLNASARSLGRPTNNAVERIGFFSGIFTEDLKPKAFDELSDAQLNNPPERSSSVKETRLEEFKRLLGGPAYVPGSNYYSPSLPVTGSALLPQPASLRPTGSSTSLPANSRDSFTSRAGLVGAPLQLQSLPRFAATAPGLNPTPPPAPPAPPRRPPESSFSIPKRQF